MNSAIDPDNLKELSLALRQGKLPLQDYIIQTLSYIEKTEPVLGALLPEDNRQERLLKQAEELLLRFPEPEMRPPLFGILIGVKDLFNVDGLPTRAGSKLPPEVFAGKEAEIVTSLKNLGALILGKTTCTEFAYFQPSQTKNPCNLKHTPGGSSSGSAAAVAAGYCLLSLGTQTIGSIIRPASYCGVTGLKPTYGLFSLQGVFPFSQTVDHIGFITRQISDLSFLLPLLDLFASEKITNRPVLGAVTGSYLQQADASVQENYFSALNKLLQNGYKIITGDPFGDINSINARHNALIAAEFALNHKRLFARYQHLYSESSKELYARGLKISSTELELLRKQTIMFRKKIVNLMQEEKIDLWVTPSTTTTAPPGLNSTGSPLMSLPWTNCGLPALTIPNGLDENGLPFGVQFVASYNEDFKLIQTVQRILDRQKTGISGFQDFAE